MRKMIAALLAASGALLVTGCGEVPARPAAEKPAVQPAAAPRAEAPRAETARVEVPKAETPRVETPKAETPKVEAPKAETPAVKPPEPAAEAKPELEPGLVGEYFGLDEAIEDFPALAADKKPSVKRVDKEVNYDSVEDAFAGTELADHFYVRWTGVLKVAKDAKYTFYTESDDGSRLYVDGKQVVDNGGLHAMEEKSGETTLTAGDHQIKVDFFENEGGAGCKAFWETEGIEKQVIPASALFHLKGAEK